MVGGSVSYLAGGKFGNGAATGAMQMAFNELMHNTPGFDSEIEGAPNYTPEAFQTPWVPLAEGELGVAEVPGTTHNPRILEYHETTSPSQTTDDGTGAWCSSFVNWTFTKAGIVGSNSAWAANWETWGQNLGKKGAVGAVASIAWPNGGHHVALVVGQTSNGRIVILGGNQGAGVVSYTTVPLSYVSRFVYPTGFLISANPQYVS